MTNESTYAYYAERIERIVSMLVRRSRAKIFRRVPRTQCNKLGLRATELGGEFLQWVNNCPYEGIKEAFPIHARHPLIDLFWKHTRELAWAVPGTEAYIERVQQCVRAMRDEARSPAFRAVRNMHTKLVMQNTASLLNYIDALFGRWGRLLVIRLDLGYAGAYTQYWPKDGSITYETAREHRQNFFSYLRRNIKLQLRGYAWKLEYAPSKSFHYHTLLFFSGDHHQKDVIIAEQLGEFWKGEVTAGFGSYYNCNADSYLRRGIGRFHYADNRKMAILKGVVAPYLTKPDYYIRLVLPNGRTFDRGNLPKRRAIRHGRPRVRVIK